jgi:hypothetical protein
MTRSQLALDWLIIAAIYLLSAVMLIWLCFF